MPDLYTCNPPTTLRFGSLPGLLASLPPPSELAGGVQVDLSGLRWIEALPIATLVAYLKAHLVRFPETKNRISVPPKYEYLQRMDFFEALGTKLEEPFQRRDPAGRFVPVRFVDSSARVAEAADEIVSTLRVNDEDAAKTLRHSVGELLDNVFVHAHSSVHAAVCAQHFPNACRSQVAIVDTGMGFTGSFGESPILGGMTISDEEALRLGFTPFLTSKPRTGDTYETSYGRLGVGLFIVGEILRSVGGRLLVVSGSAAIDHRGHRVVRSTVRPWQGTIVGFDVPDEPDISYRDALAQARQRARDMSRQGRLL